jgi:hypothetical protein
MYINKPFVSNLICYCFNLQSTYSITVTLSLVVLVTVWMCTVVYVLFYSKIYCTSSNGCVRFNLLTRPSLFRSWRAFTLMCRWSRCSWLWAYFLMTLSTVSTSGSLCRLSFRMYQGASAIPRSTLFWNLYIMFLLLRLVQPQSWTP